MKKTRLFFLISGIIFIIFGILSISIPITDDWGGKRYIGNLVFNTEQEYVQFKQAIVDTKASMNKMEVLASTPPIIVSFDIIIKDNTLSFPYGETSRINSIGGGVFILLAGIGLILFGWFVPDENRGSKQ